MRLAVVAAALVVATTARADWEVTRSPFDARVVARYKEHLRQNPDDTATLKKLVALYKKHRTVEELEREWARAGDATGLHLAGHLQRERGDWKKAAELYEKSGTRAAKLSLAEAYVRLDRAGEAKALLDEALAQTTDPPRRRELLRRVVQALLADRTRPNAEIVGEARRRYDELLGLDPRDSEARRELAEMLAARGQPKAAAVEWRTLADGLRGDPGRRAEALRRIGELEEAADDHAAALDAYKKAYALAPAGHHMRREALDRIIGIHRKKDELRTLIGSFEREWAVGARGFLEWETLARLWDETGDPARAQDCYKKALAVEPHALDARRRLIALLERAGKDADVIAEYRRLVQAAPGEPRFRLELAERLWKRPDGSKEAVAACEKLGRETDDPSVHSALADLYARWGLHDKALAEREKLVRLEPDDDAHLVSLGELYWQKGKKDRALETWRRLLSTGKKREQQMARLAEVYGDHEMAGEALELFQKAVKLAPKDAALQKGLASAYERMHRDAEAERVWLDLFEQAAAAKQRGSLIETRQKLVLLLARLGRLGTRAHEWRSRFAVERDRSVGEAFGLLAADAYLKLGRLEQAEEMLRSLAERAHDDETRADAQVGLAQVYKSRRKLKEAIAALEKAATLAPARAREIYAQIAELSLSLYRDADALAYAKKAIALGPGDAQAQVRLAEVLERRDDMAGAIEAYARALELDDRMWRVHFALARLHLRRGENEKAARLYRDVMRRAPEEELVVDAARRAIDLEEYLGSLGELERELAPLAYAHPDRKIYHQLLLELYERYARPLAARARHGDEAAKKDLQRLGEHGLRPLLDVLIDGDPQQQRGAVSLLGELGNPAAAAPLLRLALQPAPKAPTRSELRNPFSSTAPPRVDLRVEAAVAGARLAGLDELPALLKLATDGEKHLRVAALYGLGRVRAPASEAQLLRSLDDDAGDVQAAACLGLGRQRASGKALVELSRLVRSTARADATRAACAFALGTAAAGASEKEVTSVRAVLADTLEEGAEDVHRKAAWALGLLGARGPARAALTRAVFTKQKEVRCAAANALAQPESQPTWREPERSPDGLDLRGWVAQLGASECRPELPPAIAEIPEAVEAAIDALSRHRDLVLRTLDDLEQPPLVELGHRVRPAVEKLVKHADRAVRSRALRLLGKLEGADAALVEALASPTIDVRLAALAGVAERHARTGPLRDAVLRALAASDWRERRAAALALALEPRTPPSETGVTRALSRLAAEDPNGFVREAATHALGRLH